MTDEQHTDFLENLINKAIKAGAHAADAIYVEGTSVSLSCRLGKTEHLERSEGTDLGLRVFVGQQQAIVSSSDMSSEALDRLIERGVAMARSVPADPHCGLAHVDQLAVGNFPDLELDDPCDEPDTEALKARALEAEDAARSVAGVTNTEGGSASWGRSCVALASSNGFTGQRAGSRSGVSVCVLAGEGTNMERDYDYASTVFASDLPSPAELGQRAGEKAVARLNPRQVTSMKAPVVFDPRVSNSLIGHLAGAINGASIARGTSFLKDAMGKQIFPKDITIVDDPHRVRGLRSKAFDAEGLATSRRNIIEDGVLQTWILSLSSARQLGLASTGHASRGTSSPPGPAITNFYLQAGDISREELIGDIKQGLLVTEMIGSGVNNVTGDYSRGATGFWIENGEISFPVSEITIAGNLNEMFAGLSAADDLEFRQGTNAPTLRIETMAIAGL
jgi:PmbA protein